MLLFCPIENIFRSFYHNFGNVFFEFELKKSYSDIFNGFYTITPIKAQEKTGKFLRSKASVSVKFKNKLEAIGSIRLHMYSFMAEAYEHERKQRFSENQMHNCVTEEPQDHIPSDQASFRVKIA